SRTVRKDDDWNVRSTSQPLRIEELTAGSIEVEVKLPAVQTGESADDRFELLLSGFAFQPRPGTYQLSNILRLQPQGDKVVPDPSWQDGWNLDVRRPIEELL